MPARGRYLHQHFCSSFISIFGRRIENLGGLRNTERDDAVLSGRSSGLRVCSRICAGRLSRGSALAYWRVLAEVSGKFLEDFIQWQRRALRDCAEPQGGDFQGSAIPRKLFGFFWVS